MDFLYTKNGVPVRVREDKVFNPSGRQFGRIKGSKVCGSDGRYVGTVVGDRLVDRSTDSATVGSPFTPSIIGASTRMHRMASMLWGDEPDIGED